MDASAAGKGFGEPGQYDDLLVTVVRQPVGSAVRSREREVRCDFTRLGRPSEPSPKHALSRVGRGRRRQTQGNGEHDSSHQHLPLPLQSPDRIARIIIAFHDATMMRVGAVLGTYEIIELIGEGGMGAVYRARDSRLGREVAIKVIRPDLASQPDRLPRFDREARLLASLNHPNIATVHGFELIENVPFLVMELVDGETLADRSRPGPLPIKEAVAIGAQIAAAMEAAHERGIIHRDLKPSYIKLTQSGSVKVLDFGLAKAAHTGATAEALVGSPTLTSGGTAEGVVLGTVAFMSPEQARGKTIDRRTDVWAFGCVLFDMFTGRSAFGGATISDTLSNILTRDPDWSALPPDVPPSIRRLLRRCLEKELSRRLRDMGDARLELEEAVEGREETRSSLSTDRAGGRRLWLVAGITAIASGALVAAAMWSTGSGASAPPPRAIRFALSLAESERLTSSDFPVVAFAPDEAHVAYVATRGGRSQLFVRALSSLNSVPLPGTEGALTPFFSPDGQWIGFFADGKLKKVPVQGGPVRTLADAPIGFGASWAANSIVFAPANGSALFRVSDEGGTPSAVTTLDTTRGEFSHRWPDLTYDGTAVVFTTATEGSWDDADIVVQPLGAATRHVLVRGGSNPRFVGAWRLAYMRGGTLFLATLDSRNWRLASEPVPVVDAVAHSGDGAAQFSVSAAGGLLYLPDGADESARTLVWVDRQGAMQPLAAPPRPYTLARLSPDGRMVALAIGGETAEEIWSYEIARNALSQLTYDAGSDPVWSGDGSRIIFSALRDGSSDLFWKRTERSAVEERLTRSPLGKIPHSISPDGSTLAFVEDGASKGGDIAFLTLADRIGHPFLNSSANETSPAFSPDGRWIAYVSDADGRNEVFVASPTAPVKPVRVSAGGGTEPLWRRDGAELFYRAADRMMAAVVRSNGTVDRPRELFRAQFHTGRGGRVAYDISADGTRFLMIKPPESEPRPAEMRVVLGWSATAQPLSGAASR